MAAGFVYTFLGLAVKLRGVGFIDRLLPPVVIAPVIISIGLGLSPVAANMAMGKAGDGSAQLVPYATAMMISMPALSPPCWWPSTARACSALCRSSPGSSSATRWPSSSASSIPRASALRLAAIPAFVAPEFHWGAILFMVPVALAPAIEHVGGVIAVGGVTGKNYLKQPGLHRTCWVTAWPPPSAGLFGGPPNTTYAEVTGAVMLTKNHNPRVMLWAAGFAMVLAFVGKFGAGAADHPVPVMGGILCLLFGSIAVVGLNILIRHQVDLSEARNLVIVSVTLVFGIGGIVFATARSASRASPSAA